MTATPVASAAARTPIQTAPSTTDEERHAYALLQATSDATLAKMYLAKGNIPAARRKAVQLLKALQSLSKPAKSRTQQAQAATKTVANTGSKGGLV